MYLAIIRYPSHYVICKVHDTKQNFYKLLLAGLTVTNSSEESLRRQTREP